MRLFRQLGRGGVFFHDRFQHVSIEFLPISAAVTGTAYHAFGWSLGLGIARFDFSCAKKMRLLVDQSTAE